MIVAWDSLTFFNKTKGTNITYTHSGRGGVLGATTRKLTGTDLSTKVYRQNVDMKSIGAK